MQKKDVIILSIILIVALAVRLYKIDTPLADLHSWRQADTAAVARNFVRDGFDLLKPTYDDLSSIQTGQENPEGLRMVEFPIYNALFAFFYKYLPIVSLEIYGRLTSIISSLITIAVIYYLSLKEKNRIAAIGASSMYALFPFFIFFSRVVLPESTALSFMMLSLFFLYLSLQKKSYKTITLILAALFFALSVLTKPTTIFYSIAAGYLFITTYTFDVFKNWRPYVFFLIGLIPLIWWRWYILQFPAGIPASEWLLTHVNTSEGLVEIFFRPAFFRWIFMERIGIEILGVFGVFFLILGAVAKQQRYFIHSILLSALVYLCTFQGGNVQHNYYQALVLPALALVSGLGLAFLIDMSKEHLNQFFLYPTLILIITFSIFFSYYRVKDFYGYSPDLLQIAELIKTFTNEDDKIVTDRLGDTTLLYLADRKGAPAVYAEVSELQRSGYSYIVTANTEFTDRLREEGHTVIVENELFSLIKL